MMGLVSDVQLNFIIRLPIDWTILILYETSNGSWNNNQMS